MSDGIMSAQSVPLGSSEAPPNVQEFVINVPKNQSKDHHVVGVHFNAAMNVDVAHWKMVKSERLMNDAGAGEDAAFYVFVQATNDAVDAYPLNDWYNLQPVRSHNLSPTETEHESGRRNNAMNLLSLMSGMRLQGDDCVRPDSQYIKADPEATNENELMKSDMFDWMNDISDSDDDKKPTSKEDENGGDTKKTKKNGQPVKRVKPNKKRMQSDESNDGNKEVRELRHISVSTDKEPSKSKGNRDINHLPEEDLPRPLLMFDEGSVQEKESADSDEKKDKPKTMKVMNAKEAQVARDQKQWKELKRRLKEEKTDSLGKPSSHSQDNLKKKRTSESPNHKSRLVSLVTKRRMTLPTYLRASENSKRPTTTPAKRSKLDSIPLQPSSTNDSNLNRTLDDYGITEAVVRRFLVRKPMTIMELLTKFKTKKSGALSEQLVDTMTSILKKIKPVQQIIEGNVYLHIDK